MKPGIRDGAWVRKGSSRERHDPFSVRRLASLQEDDLVLRFAGFDGHLDGVGWFANGLLGHRRILMT